MPEKLRIQFREAAGVYVRRDVRILTYDTSKDTFATTNGQKPVRIFVSTCRETVKQHVRRYASRPARDVYSLSEDLPI